MDGYKHYIRIQRIGSEDIVVHKYSTAFEEVQTGDLLLYDDAPRHAHETTPAEIDNEREQHKYKLVNNQMVERTQTELDDEFNTVSKRRQDVLNKWDPRIDAQRETLRKLQDEDKPAAAINKAKTNLHNLVASKNTEFAGVK